MNSRELCNNYLTEATATKEDSNDRAVFNTYRNGGLSVFRTDNNDIDIDFTFSTDVNISGFGFYKEDNKNYERYPQDVELYFKQDADYKLVSKEHYELVDSQLDMTTFYILNNNRSTEWKIIIKGNWYTSSSRPEDFSFRDPYLAIKV